MAVHVTREARPAPTGIGLRGPHVAAVEATRPRLGFLEVHAENYVTPGAHRDRLLRLRRDYKLSLHGVGLSLGSADTIDRAHLQQFADLVALTEPMLVSEHLSWSIVDDTYLNDLLPLPYTEETLRIVARNVDVAQEALGRRILIENPSRYLRFRHSTIPEPAFLSELVRRTGCGILCDVNNIYVCSANLGEDACAYLRDLPADAIGEIHLAGHTRAFRRECTLLIDDHGAPVCDAVWSLYREALRRFGRVPSLIEWDKNLPELPVLLAEGRRAERENEDVIADALAS